MRFSECQDKISEYSEISNTRKRRVTGKLVTWLHAIELTWLFFIKNSTHKTAISIWIEWLFNPLILNLCAAWWLWNPLIYPFFLDARSQLTCTMIVYVIFILKGLLCQHFLTTRARWSQFSTKRNKNEIIITTIYLQIWHEIAKSKLIIWGLWGVLIKMKMPVNEDQIFEHKKVNR